MSLFKDNYLHEIPIDIQFKIMDIIKKQEYKHYIIVKKKFERLYMYHNDTDECNKDIIAIFVDFKFTELKDINDFYNKKYEFINKWCNNKNYKQIKTAVHYYGIFKAINLCIKEFDINIFDTEKTDEERLYRQCYFLILYYEFDFTYEDIRLYKLYSD